MKRSIFRLQTVCLASLSLTFLLVSDLSAQLVTHSFSGVMRGGNELFNVGDLYEGSYTLESSATVRPHPDITLNIQSQAISPTYPGTEWNLTVHSTKIPPFTLNGSNAVISVGNDVDWLGNGITRDRFVVTLFVFGSAPLPAGLTFHFFEMDFIDVDDDSISEESVAESPNLALTSTPGGRFLTSSTICSQCQHTVTSFGNNDPIADAGADQQVDCTGPDGANVSLDATASTDPNGDDLEFEWSVPSGSGAMLLDSNSETPIGIFPLGPTLVTLTVTDGNGGMDVDDVLVTVEDTTPPVLVCTTDKIMLWPPNHQMEVVWICIAVTDDCSHPDDLQIDCTVSSNEPDDANGDGSTAGDVDGLDGFTAPVLVQNLTYDAVDECFYGLVSLRAERDGANEGRVYSIVCDVVDTEGNEATASCVVIVPHNKRK